MKSYALAFAALLATTAGSAAPEPGLSRAAFVERVVAGSARARLADAEVGAAEAERAGTGRLPNPSVSWQRGDPLSGARAEESDDALALSAPLVLSGRLGLEQAAADAAIDAARARRDRSIADLRRAAVRAYDAALAAAERRAALDVAAAAVVELGRVAAAREAAGEAAGYERVRIDLERAVLADLQEGAAAEEAEARATARALLGPGAGALPPLSDGLAPPEAAVDTAPLLAAVEARRRDLEALRHEGAAASTAARAAERRAVPDPEVTAGVQLLDVARDPRGFGYLVGLSVPVPLFDAGQGDAARGRARATAATARRDALLHEARARIAREGAVVTARRARWARHGTEVLARADHLRDLVRAAWKAGGANLLVVVDAERTAREARLTAIDLARAARDAETELWHAAGVFDRPGEPP